MFAFVISYILVNLNLGLEVPEDGVTPKHLGVI